MASPNIWAAQPASVGNIWANTTPASPNIWAPGGVTSSDLNHTDFLSGLWHDIEQTATSIPSLAVRYLQPKGPLYLAEDTARGLYEAGKTFVPMGQAYWDLSHFDIGGYRRHRHEYEQQFYEQPLLHLLAPLIVARGGIGRIGALGRVAEKAAAEGRAATGYELARAATLGLNPPGPREQISARLGTDIQGVGKAGTPVVTRELPRSYFRAEQAKIVDSLLKRTSPNTPLVGEARRAARALRRTGRVPYLALMSNPAYYKYEETWRSMSRPEKVASRMANLFPEPTDLESYINDMEVLGTPGADLTHRILTDERNRHFYDNPSDKMRQLNQLGHELDQARQRILIDAGAAVPDENGVVREFVEAPYRHTLRQRGAQLATNSWVYRHIRKTNAELNRLEGVKKKIVSDAKRFGTEDLADITKQGRAASNDLIRESGYRARIHEGPGVRTVDPELKARRDQVARYYEQAAEGSAHKARLGRQLQQLDEQIAAARGENQPVPPSLDLQDLSRQADEAGQLSQRYRDEMNAVLQGEMDTNTMTEFGMTPEGGMPAGEAAIADAVQRQTLRNEQADLARLQELHHRAQTGQLTDEELSVLAPRAREVQSSADARVERDRIEARLKEADKYHLTDEEIVRMQRKSRRLSEQIARVDPEEAARIASEAQTELDRIEKAMNERRARNLTPKEKRRMTRRMAHLRLVVLRWNPEAAAREVADKQAEIARIQARVDDPARYGLGQVEVSKLQQKIRNLNADIFRLQQSQRMLGARHAQAEKVIRRDVAEQQQRVNEVSDFSAIPDLRQRTRSAVMAAFESRYHKQAKLHERLLAAEHAVRTSMMRSAEAVGRASRSEVERQLLRERKIKYIASSRARMRDLLEHQSDLRALRDELNASRGQLISGWSPELLRQEFERNGRMLPYYTPDVFAEERPRRFSLAQGSITPQPVRADIRESRGILQRRGLLNLGAEALGPSYFAAAKHALNVQLHAQALQMATTIKKGADLPKGYEFLRQTTGETIGPVERKGAEHISAIGREYDREHDLTTTDKDAKDIDWEQDGLKVRKIVPKAFADEFRQENRRAGKVSKLMFERAMDVWRTLLLHLRVPWLVNNIVGNSFLYAIRFAGVGGLASVLRMYARDERTKGLVPRMRQLASYVLSKEDMRQLLPEHERGTHFETQATGETPMWVRNLITERQSQALDTNTLLRAAVKGVQAVPTLLPRADKWWERRLRRMAASRILRGSEEVKSAFNQIREQGQSPTFRAAVDKAMEGNPELRDWVSQEINTALGDFLSLSRVERQWIRSLIPFYAWMREISRISGRLLIDHPERVLILNRLAQAASEIQPQEIPSYMRGAVLKEKAGWLGALAGKLPVFTSGFPFFRGYQSTPGLQTAYALHGASPYGTVTDTARAFAALTPYGNIYQLRDLIGNLNPTLGAMISAYSRPQGEANYGFLANSVEEFLRSIPQAQPISPYPSYLYPDRTRGELLTRIFGDTRVRYDPNEAAYQLGLGR